MPHSLPLPTRTLLLLTACLAALAVAGASCGGSQSRNGRRGRDCARHDQCMPGQACVLGRCEGDGLDDEMDVSRFDAEQWFEIDGGLCTYDDQCGPWMCFEGRCVTPQEAGRHMLPRRSYAFWDTSCNSEMDCGGWVCASGWCTEPGHASPMQNQMGQYGYDPYGYGYDPYSDPYGGGSSCLGDGDCGAGGECVYPGYCEAGRGGEMMTWSDIDATAWFSYWDGSCNYDTDCGPYVCIAGWCTAVEMSGRSYGMRSEYYYYDTSCNATQECGPWDCISGWCRDSAYASIYSPDPNGGGQAATGIPGTAPYYTDPYGYGCTTHTECGAGYACVDGSCQAGRLFERMNTSTIGASPYFSRPDGLCTSDADCGPWMCSLGGICSPPDEVGRQMLERRSYTYWDTSCNSDMDCGGWTCVNSFCHQPGYVDR